ncbi:AAC(3) family N-acetyltransferase [Candidatus Sumerlaeota bacterium]|nr:AAC(3) family N-acetyltransferase [Candidatus Sumerlaeota bacterium]
MTDENLPRVTREQIVDSLKKIGIHRGDILALHSSLKSLGYVEGGAETVIHAFQEALGFAGALLMPTHTYSFPIWSKPPYDKNESPSLVGNITEVFRRMPNVLRSDHPTHSVAAWGRFAADLTRDALQYPPTGIGSPWHRFHEAGGTILMLGTNQNACTMLHYCEAAADVPYLDVTFTPGVDYEVAHRINERGEVEEYILKQVPGCSRGFHKSEPCLRENGALEDVKIVNSQSQLLDSRKMVKAMKEKLKSDPFFLLCDFPDCGICVRRRNCAV